MVERVSKYQTADGKLFSRYQEAQSHEKRQEKVALLAKVFQNPRLANLSASSLAATLLANPQMLTELRDACNKGLEWQRNSVKV